MAQTREWQWLVCLGRNGWDHPLAVPDDMGTEVENVELIETGLGQKRRGTVQVAIGGDTFSGASQLYNFIPAQDPTKAELWIVSADTPNKVLRVPDTNAVNVALADGIEALAQQTSFCAFNGKLYVAYKSGVNRLHVYDPTDTDSPNTLRRVGLMAPPPAFVNAADTGSGSYAATPRFYRAQYIRRNAAGALRATSPLSAPLSFTPSGIGSGVSVGVYDDGATVDPATHARFYGSSDGVTFYDLSGEVPLTTPPAWTAFIDTRLPSEYSLLPASPLEGASTPFPSVKYLATDGVHLFGFGVYETDAGDSIQPIPGRIYFTPALYSSNLGDDERVSNTIDNQGWIDARPNSGGIDRGIAGPVNDRMYVFQSDAIFMLAPTGTATAPYARVVLTTQYGAVSNNSIVLGEDEAGQPCLYFLNPADGPRRLTIGRTIDWCGKDVYDIWKQIDLDAAAQYAHGMYDARRKLVLWFLPLQGSTYPNLAITFDVTKGRVSGLGVRYGWSKWTGIFSYNVLSSAAFSKTLSVPRTEWAVPYIYSGVVGLSNVLYRVDETVAQDNGTPYTSTLTSKAWDRGSLLQMKRTIEAWLVARVGSVSLLQTLIKDWNEETRTSTVDLSQKGSETRVMRRFDPVNIADFTALQIQLGDDPAGTRDVAWLLDRWAGSSE